MQYPKVGPFRVFALDGEIKVVHEDDHETHTGTLTVEEARELVRHLNGLADAATRRSDAEYIEKARLTYEKEGTIEIDDDAKVSRGDSDGAYVQAWVWVDGAPPKKVKKVKSR